jgi:hypothetical protein
VFDANAAMSEAQVLAQLVHLATGRLVVLRFRQAGVIRTLVGVLMPASQTRYALMLSPDHNSVPGVEQMDQVRSEVLPTAGITVQWVVSAQVYTEALGYAAIETANEKLARVTAERDALHARSAGAGGLEDILRQQVELTRSLVAAQERKAGIPRVGRPDLDADSVAEWTGRLENDADTEALAAAIRNKLVTPYAAQKGGDRLLELYDGVEGFILGAAHFDPQAFMGVEGLVRAGNRLWWDLQYQYHYCKSNGTLTPDAIKTQMAKADKDLSNIARAVAKLGGGVKAKIALRAKCAICGKPGHKAGECRSAKSTGGGRGGGA